jgi:tellurite resistance protein TerC
MLLILATLSKPLFFTIFMLFVILGLALDLGLFTKNKPHVIQFKEAFWRTIGWVGAGLAFSIVIYFTYANTCGFETNRELAMYKDTYGSNFTIHSDINQTISAFSAEMVIQYLTGYFIEYSLSIDNLFVMMLVFSSFNVNEQFRKKILLWGVLGAVIMRFVFIFAGSALLTHFHWLMYVFGGILLFSGIKLLVKKEENDQKIDTEKHPIVRFARKIFPISSNDHHGKFLIRDHGKLMFTSLFIVLLVIEFTDVIFAVDSVPAIFGITRDPYIVFFSNIFAIMGLRSLYFLLSHSLAKVHTLKYGLSMILIFIGFKMLFENWFKIIGFNHIHNLLVLFIIIGGTVLFAWILPNNSKNQNGDNISTP